MKTIKIVNYSVILCLFTVMVFFLCSFRETDDFFRYEISDGEAVIISYAGERFSTKAEIPEKLEGFPVTTIKESAFYGNEYLKKIIVPGCVKTIEQYAFGYCTDLTDVVFEDSEESLIISDYAFTHCTDLRKVIFSNKRKTEIGSFAFENCIRLGKTTIPSSVRKIGFEAFSGCEQLILITDDSDEGARYASEHNIPVSFQESDTFSFIIILSAVAILLCIIYCCFRIMIKRADKKSDKAEENSADKKSDDSK